MNTSSIFDQKLLQNISHGTTSSLSGLSQAKNWQETLQTLRNNSPTQNGASALFTAQHKEDVVRASSKEEEVKQQKQALLKASESFEALLVYQMFQAMEKNLSGDELIGENHATKIFKDFLSSEHSMLAVKNYPGGLGLAKMIYEENVKYIDV